MCSLASPWSPCPRQACSAGLRSLRLPPVAEPTSQIYGNPVSDGAS
jgi:hypothetical protein